VALAAVPPVTPLAKVKVTSLVNDVLNWEPEAWLLVTCEDTVMYCEPETALLIASVADPVDVALAKVRPT
jgi:hypothetical protein